MSATEEQMALLATANVSHVSYILLLYSVSFLLFLFVCMLLHLYATHAFPATSKPDITYFDIDTGESGRPSGEERLRNGHVARDAEEFELEGLMSDEEEEGEGGTGGKKKLQPNGIAR